MSRVAEIPQSTITISWVALAVGMIVVSHFTVDAYANSIPAILGLLEVRCGLTKVEASWFAGFGAITSGLAQPFFAWLSDRWDTRLFGGLGLIVSVVAFCCLGFATDAFSLFAIYGCAMIGVGMYHPIAASTIGQAYPTGRSYLISLFFVAGMGGSVAGAIAGPRIVQTDAGFQQLPWLILPTVIMAGMLHWAIAHVPHRTSAPARRPGSPANETPHWFTFAALYFAAVLRFSVNLCLFYLYLRLLQQRTQDAHPEWTLDQVSHLTAPTLGNMVGATMAGMAIGGLLSGVLIRSGREKWPMVCVPILFAPVILLFPLAPLEWSYPLALIAGTGFASLIPVGISVAQRLLPQHTSIASSMMLGGAWAMSMLAPRITQSIISSAGLTTAFVATAITLVLSGLVILPVRASAFALTSHRID